MGGDTELTKKFIIKEIWLLDKDGNNTLQLKPIDEKTIPNLFKEEDVRGGYGNNKN